MDNALSGASDNTILLTPHRFRLYLNVARRPIRIACPAVKLHGLRAAAIPSSIKYITVVSVIASGGS